MKNSKLQQYKQVTGFYRNLPVFLLVAISMSLSAGCDNTPTEVEDYNPEPVLSAFLCNGEPVTEVFLERVAPLLDYYEFENNGITGALITISGAGDTLHFIDDEHMRGRYIPAPGESLIPLGLVTYRIEVVTPAPHNEYIWAETLVPGQIEEHGPVQINLEDEMGNVYQVQEGDTLNRMMPNMIWHWSDVDSAAGFQGIALSLADRDSLISLDPGWDPDDPDDELEDYQKQRVNYQVMRFDQRSVKIIWLAFHWEGPYRVELLAISQSYWDYLFSMMRVDQGLINNVPTNINGGTGIFAAISKFSMNIYMEKVQ